MAKSNRIEELYDWLKVNKIQYSVVDSDVAPCVTRYIPDNIASIINWEYHIVIKFEERK